MKRLVTAVVVVVFVAAAVAANSADLRTEANALFKPIPSSPPELKDNPLTPEKVELGKKLYFEPRLSASGLISCNTCHNLSISGDDNLPTSVGHGWAKGPRNAPTVFNAVFNVAQFWDGRAEDLKAQAKGPVQAGVEMNSTPEKVTAVLNSAPEYVEEFKRAFPGEKDPVSFDNMAKAIEAFEATLLTPGSRFDQFLQGTDSALTDREKKGLQLFMSTGCSGCHNGVNVGGDGYHAFGVVQKPGAEILPPGDKGRFTVTKTATDEYVFRAGPLRNIALTAPYFHSGQVWDLKQAVGIMGISQLGQEVSDGDAQLIAEFLHTLTGVRPQVQLPLLPGRTETTPKPQL